MLLIIICLSIWIISIGLSIIDSKVGLWRNEDPIIAVIVLNFFYTIVLLLIFSISHIGVSNNIEQSRMRYKSLCKRNEICASNYEKVSQSELIKDITEWNQEVYNTKYWTDNIWTSWLFSKKYADSLKYIEYKGEN